MTATADGAAFEAGLDPAVRRARGVHFTPPREVGWVVDAVLVRPWLARIDAARSVRELDALRERLAAVGTAHPH